MEPSVSELDIHKAQTIIKDGMYRRDGGGDF